MSHKFDQGCVDPAAPEPLLGIAGFREVPPHVAQQSRRDKLRVQQFPVAYHLLGSGGSEYDQALFSSSVMLDFAGTHDASDSSTYQDAAAVAAAAGGGLWKQDWMSSCIGGGVEASIQNPLYPYHLKSTGISAYQENADLRFASSSSSPNNNVFCNKIDLQDVVTSSSMEIASLVHQNNSVRDPSHPWADGGNELVLLNHTAPPRLDSSTIWLTHRQPLQQNNTASTQALSLSLSSNPLPELHVAQFEDRSYGRNDFTASPTAAVNNVTVAGGGHQKFTGSYVPTGDARRGTGPLGPFTGYATILKSSKFLKPAQQLLDEFCNAVTGSKQAHKQCESAQDRSSGVVAAACDAPLIRENQRNSGGTSSSSFYSSTATAIVGGAPADQGGGGGGTGDCQIHRPEFQQKKAKLLYMQEEVCRRYKQFHQQIQMVVSSFESVAGLSAATPNSSLALKAVSKHFRCLKNAISDQLRYISNILGEEFMSSPGSSNITGTPRLKLVDQSLRKQKSGDGGSCLLEHAQPVWRPQRGLPERSVAVLRAWLFEHFLHPYPSDTDKHMLASQTGLSRNQVSNWFINARVRLWKPMVEEIHMLETKGVNEMDLNSLNKNDIIPGPPTDDSGYPSTDHRSGQSSKPSDCSSLGSVPTDDGYRPAVAYQWHREKRTRMDCMVPGGLDTGLMSFATAYQGGVDLGGFGAVSLTLGLRHNEGANNVVHQQQQQQHQIRSHFGGQMVHDFVG